MKKDDKQRPAHETQAEVKKKAYVPPRMQVFKLGCQLLAASRQATCGEMIEGTKWYDYAIFLYPEENTNTLAGTPLICNDPQAIIDKWHTINTTWSGVWGPDGGESAVSLDGDLGDGVTLRELLTYGTVLPGCDFGTQYDSTACYYTAWATVYLCYKGKGYRVETTHDG